MAVLFADGTGVKTSGLDPMAGFLIKKRHIELRRPDALGVIVGGIPKHAGYWVLHDGEELPAAYLYKEVQEVEVSVIWPVTYRLDGSDWREEYASYQMARTSCKGHRLIGVVEDPLIQPPIFSDREPVLGPVELIVDRPSAWDRLQGDDEGL